MCGGAGRALSAREGSGLFLDVLGELMEDATQGSDMR